MAPSLLVVDDDPSELDRLATALGARGWTVTGCRSGPRALELVEEAPVDVILTDAHLDGASAGLELCREIVRRWPRLPVIVGTSLGSLELAVSALRAGASDFVTKPVDAELMLLVLDRALQLHRLEQEVQKLRRRVRSAGQFGELIGESEAMRGFFKLLERVAKVPSSVLILGESGTGKELVARALHERSARADRPFVAINCAAMPEQLLESELFGHVRGAFTDARADRKGLLLQADGGTLFLDEIGDMPMGLQAKLLRVLQERRVRPVGAEREVAVDVRVIAATHQDLEAAAVAGRFREDLLFRLDVIRLDVPPLRDRGGDVLLLAQRFLEQFARRFDKSVRGFAPDAAGALVRYPWPGNVRELQNCVERAVALAVGEEVQIQELPPKVARYSVAASGAASPAGPPTEPARDDDLWLTLEEVERRHILRVLAACGGVRQKAAARLGLDRKTLYRKLQQYGHGGDEPVGS